MQVPGTVLLCVCLLSSQAFAGPALIVGKAEKEIRLTGYTRNERSMTVASEVSGRVLKVNYDVGQAVGEAPFVEVDTTFVGFELESTLQSIRKVQANLKKARSRAAYLNKEFERVDRLHKGDRETEVKRDAAQQELDQARLDLDSLAHDQAALQVTLKELEERKERHMIFAPRGWTVTARTVEPGEMIMSGAALATVSNYGNLVVPLSLSNEELEALRDLPPELDVELERKPSKASIHWINPEFDENTRKLKIELMIKGDVPDRRGGLQCVLPLRIRAKGLLVPREAVVSRYDNPKVTVKEGREVVPLMVLGDAEDGLLVAENGRLAPGMELLPASSALEPVAR